jgi:hypothetical protein
MDPHLRELAARQADVVASWQLRALKRSSTAPDNPCMPQDRHEAIAPDAPPAPSFNEFTPSDAAQGQYVPPPTSIPDEYWQQAAQAHVAAGSYTSTVACWAFVLLGLMIPFMALGASLWAAWMARDDSRFVPPAAVGLGIFLLPFLG